MPVLSGNKKVQRRTCLRLTKKMIIENSTHMSSIPQTPGDAALNNLYDHLSYWKRLTKHTVVIISIKSKDTRYHLQLCIICTQQCPRKCKDYGCLSPT